MPYVQRDHRGEIIGLYANPQPQQDGIDTTLPDPLPETNPEVIAFREKMASRFGSPPPPITPGEAKRQTQNWSRLDKEHKEISGAVLAFNAGFTELEISLSTLLYCLINIPSSQIAYAIYFSPTGFEARVEIVNNTIQQVLSENPKLEALSILWKRIYKKIDPARRLRNALAHGTQQTIHIRGNAYARFTPLAFDVNRLGRQMATRQIPGFTASDITGGSNKIRVTVEHIDHVNRIIKAFYDGDPTFEPRLINLKQVLSA